MMIQLPAKGFLAIALPCLALLGVAHATDPLPAQTQLVAAANAPVTTYGTTPPGPLSFTISTAEDLVVTLTDLQIPGPLVSAGVVVTQAGAIAGSAQLTAPATTATASLPAASGDFTLYVIGVPNTNYSVGTFSVCVAPKTAPANCIQSASLSGAITAQSTAKDPTVSTLSTSLVVGTAGSYTFTFGDLQFPVALNTPPNLALFQGSSPVPPGQTTPAITSGSSLTLSPGTYNLLAIAQADPTVQSGLYSIVVTGPAGVALVNQVVPVGLTTPGTPINNPNAQSLTLKVSDYAFPGALASASALLTSGGTVLGTASAAGTPASFTAPAGTLFLWTYGSAGATPGTFSADVAGATDLYTAAQSVQLSGSSTYAFAFEVSPATPLTVGTSYQVTAADLQFPAQLGGLSFAVAQNGVILQQSSTAGTLNFNAVAGTAVLLASAQAPDSSTTSTNGLFDINLQTTGASAQLLFDKTQTVSSTPTLFSSQSLTLGVNASFDVNLTDLKFPAAFDTLALVVSRGSDIVGKIYGGGLFSFGSTPGTYQLTFVATPATQPTQQEFGLYGLSVVYSPPAVTLTSNVASAATGTAIQLSWTTTNASSCTATGGSFTGDQPTGSGNASVILTATTTYTLSCTGTGGTGSQSVTVTATAAPATSSHGGGGAVDIGFLALSSVLVAVRIRRRRA